MSIDETTRLRIRRWFVEPMDDKGMARRADRRANGGPLLCVLSHRVRTATGQTRWRLAGVLEGVVEVAVDVGAGCWVEDVIDEGVAFVGVDGELEDACGWATGRDWGERGGVVERCVEGVLRDGVAGRVPRVRVRPGG